MLSSDKVELLNQRVNEWGDASGIPDNVRQMVVKMGVENPQTRAAKEGICEANFWSSAVIDYFDQFVKYLESAKQPEAPKAQDKESLLLSLRSLRKFVDQIIEQVENGQ